MSRMANSGTVNEQARIAFHVTDVGFVVVNAVSVEGQRGEPK